MKERYIYEVELEKNEFGGYSASFPELPDAFTYGEDLEETVDRAAEVLQLIIAEYLDEGKPLPNPVFRGSQEKLCLAISVDVSPELIERVKCMTVTEAAKALGVTKGRVAHMLDAGILLALPFGNERLVTIASVNMRKSHPRRPGRPKATKNLVEA